MPKTAHRLVAEKIKQTRKTLGKNQWDIANHLGMNQQAISKYENGIAGIPIRNLIKICEFLGIETDEILALYTEDAVDTALGSPIMTR